MTEVDAEKLAANDRWSTTRCTNLEVPSYVPPEAMVMEDGQFMHVFLLRAQLADINRLLDSGCAADYFAYAPLDPEFDAEGNRTNTPEKVLREKQSRLMEQIENYRRTYVETAEAEQQKSREIVRRIYFTPQQMAEGSWGSIIGARGQVHKDLTKKYNCSIALAGRGITNTVKDPSAHAAALAMLEPHVKITATNETDLQNAIAHIEWIVSDDPEAEDFREKNRRQVAQIEGRYDPQTWVTAAERRARAMGQKRPRDEAASGVKNITDAELDQFLNDDDEDDD